ncbi:DUF397 domain-containing protein [Streptosporangium amethystogenes subsp. fukuiense]|uniref:DUF397 domain-containing protein n=1 Tax=Streptosporangium amethystogenes subsp. fukuiense TaxID=698418 RepID=A0ABW2TD93_9ACTN
MDQSRPNLTWRKSTLSGTNNDDCVEVANLPSGGRAVRDSKNPNGPTLSFTPHAWRTFITSIKNNELG